MNVSTSGSKKCKLTKNCQAYFSVFKHAVSCWDYRESVIEEWMNGWMNEYGAMVEWN